MAEPKTELKEFFGDGFFDWQFSSPNDEAQWKERVYDPEKYWGGFSKEPIDEANYKLPGWAVGGFERWPGNPIFAPDAKSWDCGHFGGGVHNGSVLLKDGLFYYVYRGELPLPADEFGTDNINGIGYICDIGVAVSKDGVGFERAAGPLFRCGGDKKYSFEDVCLVRHEDAYYLFCNRWDWHDPTDPSACGVWLATSKDLLHWEKRGLVYPGAKRIHRNAAVVQDPHNRAVKIGGKFVMYMNHGLIGYSDDLIHWESKELDEFWPGGEGCFALADYSKEYKDNILLFTGGHHSGHFYAVGEVLFDRKNPGRALEWLERPVFAADTNYPFEAGCDARPPHRPVSHWRDTIFFTGMTRHRGKWFVYYGGSEYYTCLATTTDKCEEE